MSDTDETNGATNARTDEDTFDSSNTSQDVVDEETDDKDSSKSEDVSVEEPTSEIVAEDDLLGGLDVETSEDISIPEKLIDQVIGQEHARDVIEKAAQQKRHVMMIGAPGTGKSMLAKAMTEILPQDNLKDVLIYPNSDDDTNPKTRVVPAGQGERIIEAHREEAAKQGKMRKFLAIIVGLVIAGYGFIVGEILITILILILLFLAYQYGFGDVEANAPNLVIDNANVSVAPFKDATGFHSGALLGDVRHDPYQSGQMAVPAHERVETGAIHEASQGVLFIDEINTLEIQDQQKLMSAIQEGKFHITGQSDRSSGAMVQTEPLPTDFIMVAAGNMDAIENMHPALRNRLQGYGYEVYMNDTVDDTPEMRQKYARFVAQEVEKDDLIPHFTRESMEQVVLEAQRQAGEKGKLSLELRTLGGIVRAAGDVAINDEADAVTAQHVREAKNKSRSIEQQAVDKHMEKKERYGLRSESETKVGHVNGLAVMGEDSGIVLPVVSTVTPAQGDGSVIATGKLKEIAQEAVQNVSALIKKLSGQTLEDKDIHIQFVQTYEGVDGDSASVTVAAAVLSSLTGIPIRQDIAMTGSLSVQGEVLPVGGVTHKIEAAAKSGMNTVIIPKANEDDVLIEDQYKDKITIETVEHLADVIRIAFKDDDQDLATFAEQMKENTNDGILSISDLSPVSEPSLEKN